jgi:glycosyltransferase involved in cell wall biosynthesis
MAHQIRMSPRLSVVIPVWNGEKYLAAALDGILAQTFRDFECIIVDDGSTDETLAIVNRYVEPRLRLLRLEHGGIVTALNTGIAAACAPLIARMDADDIAHPARFEKQFRTMAENPGAVLCHTNIEQIGDPSGMTRLPHFPRTQALLAAQLCYRNPITHSSVMFRKEAFLGSGGYHPDERHAEDYGLWGRLIQKGAFIGLPEKLLQFRVHADSISKRQNAVQSALTHTFALRHCREFFRLHDTEAERVFRALNGTAANPRREWLWFAANRLPRLPWQSAELWTWAASQAIRRLLS